MPSYGALLCAAFGADCQTQAISGKGIFENCCDGNETMTSIAKRIFPADPASAWDDALFAPDAVIINLGTNDQGHAGGNQTWIDAFVAAYATFLVELATSHGNLALPFFLCAGPITVDYAPWVQRAMAIAAAKGVTNTHFIPLITAVDRCGHPDYDGHKAMAAQAQPVIAS